MTDAEKLEAIHQAILEAHRDRRKLHSTSALPGETAPAIRTSIIADILGTEYDTTMYTRPPSPVPTEGTLVSVPINPASE